MNVEEKYKKYIEHIDLNNLDFITAEEYQKLSYDEQFIEQIKWMSEFSQKRAMNPDFDIIRENIIRLLIVDRPLYKNGILLTYPIVTGKLHSSILFVL